MSGTCPVCARAVNPAVRPFCSKRCADVDLHRWLTGGYHIPGLGPDLATEIDEDEDGPNTHEDVDTHRSFR